MLLLKHNIRRAVHSSQLVAWTPLCVIGRLLRKPCSLAGSARKSSASLNTWGHKMNQLAMSGAWSLSSCWGREEKPCSCRPAWHWELCKEVQCSHHQMVLLYSALQGHYVQGCFDSWKEILNWGCFSAAWMSGEWAGYVLTSCHYSVLFENRTLGLWLGVQNRGVFRCSLRWSVPG